jgi:enoyl-CoA hydratase/3-hydroxyacyl-CoA dehydrogenase
LGEAFKEVESDRDTTVIIIANAGKAFVAGADIKFFIACINTDRLQDNYEFTSYGQEVPNRIGNCKKLVIAKVDGFALSSGLELALYRYHCGYARCCHEIS